MVYRAYLSTESGKELVAVKTVKGKVHYFPISLHYSIIFCQNHEVIYAKLSPISSPLYINILYSVKTMKLFTFVTIFKATYFTVLCFSTFL